jgi:hypothetical protein
MIESLPFIDDNGTIRVHTKGGGTAVFDFVTDADVPRDMSAAFVWFETEGLRQRLTVGDLPHQLVLSIQVGALNHLLNNPTQYVILDETGPTPQVLFGGDVLVIGFNS